MLWFVFQGLIIYGYFRLGKLAVWGFGYYKRGVTKITDRTKRIFDMK
jgi:hypothetical protein